MIGQIWNEKAVEYQWTQQLSSVFLISSFTACNEGIRQRDKYRLTRQHLRVPGRKTRTKWAFAIPLYALRTALVEAVIERGGAKPLGNRNNR